MRYITIILFFLKISCLYAQKSPLIKAFSKQKIKCHEVKYFSELRDKVNQKKNPDTEVYYISKGDQILGFFFFYGEEPQFFLANRETFTLFFAYGVDGSISIYDSVLSNPHSVHIVDLKKKKTIYNIPLLWRYPNFSITSSTIYKFKKELVKEFTAYPTKKIKPVNLNDTLVYKRKVDILKEIRFERIKLVGIEKNDNNLKPDILIFLMNLAKDL